MLRYTNLVIQYVTYMKPLCFLNLLPFLIRTGSKYNILNVFKNVT